MSEPSIIVVSPHFDDAVLSCWNVLDRHGTDAGVLTVFAGAPPPPFLGDWDRMTGAHDSASRVAERHEENRRALAVAGSASLELDLLESQYGPGTVSASDLRGYLSNAVTVYAPAADALGRPPHADHVRVRDAVLSTRPDTRLYADQPYCRFRPDFQLTTPRPEWVRHVVELTSEEAERKTRAIVCYTKEIPLLEDERAFGPFVAAEKLRYEVFWYPGESSLDGKTPRAS